MLRVSKMLLLCAFSARVGLAVRQNLKMSQSGSLTNVMEKIGALIQANDHNGDHSKALDSIRMLAANTPGQAEELNKALTDVITEIEANVDTKITAGFAATQAAVVTAINNLEAATSSALAKKTDADQADQTWFDCIGVEKSKRMAFETAAAAEDAANVAIVQPCADQEGSKMFESSPQVGEFACDFSDGDSCNKQLGAYAAMVNNLVDTLASDVAGATQTWTDFKHACDTANAHAEDMKQARGEADTAWRAEREMCQTKHEDRQLSLCSFGSALQTKCEKVGAYSHLIEEVDAVKGGPNSEPDRQAEWKTTQVTKCMLQKVIDGIDLDGQSLAACELTVKYLDSVGQFNKMQSEFATQTSETSFTCNEQTMTFKSGEIWNLPTGVAPMSAEYTTKAFRPEVNLAVGTPAFAFCEPTSQVDDEQVDDVLATPNRNEFYVWADVQTSATGNQIYSKLSKWDSWNSGAHDSRYLQGQAHGIPQIYVNDPTPGSTEDGLGTHVNVEDWFVGIERTGLVADQNYDNYRIVTGPVPAQATPA